MAAESRDSVSFNGRERYSKSHGTLHDFVEPQQPAPHAATADMHKITNGWPDQMADEHAAAD